MCSKMSPQGFSSLSHHQFSSLYWIMSFYTHNIILNISRGKCLVLALLFNFYPVFLSPSYSQTPWKGLSSLSASRSPPPIPSWTHSIEGVRSGGSLEGETTASTKDLGQNGLRNKDVHCDMETTQYHPIGAKTSPHSGRAVTRKDEENMLT